MTSTKIILERPLCFSINNCESRLDCAYNNPKYFKLFKILEDMDYELKPLENISFITDGDHGNPIYVDDGVQYIRAINITDKGLDLTDVKYITEEHNKLLSRSELRPNDILLVIVGATIGKLSIVPKIIEKSNISRDVARIVINSEYNPKYIFYYLNSFLGQFQIKKYICGSAQGGFYLHDIKKIKIILPPIEIQNKIVSQVDNLLSDAKEYYDKHINRLNDIKLDLNNLLGIKIKKYKKSFILKENQLQDRLDYYFYCPELEYIHNSLMALKISDIEIIKPDKLQYNEIINKMEYEHKKNVVFKYVDIGNTGKVIGNIISYEEDILMNLPTRARQIVKTNDVLLPRPVGSSEGIVIIPDEFNDQLVSTGFMAITVKEYSESILLWALLKSEIVQKQLFYLQSGSLQPEITPINFKKYVILPILKGKLKEKFIKESKTNLDDSIKYLNCYNDKKNQANEIFLKLLGLETVIEFE